MRVNSFVFAGVAALAGFVLWSSYATAARISDVTNTKHNFSATVTPQGGTDGASRTVRANSESEICVFCHTPHGADNSEGPLWNKTLDDPGVYTPYSSSSIDSNIGEVNGVSKLCLSCHDGTIAIGSVRVLRAQTNVNISMQGTSGGNMPDGPGANTGYTRNLGQDLSNDHPISLTYNSAFVNADGEMRSPGDDPIRVRGQNPRPGIQDIHLTPVSPGSSTGQVQCISCHDPHIRDTTQDDIKFLRFNRLQTSNPNGSNTFLPNSDIICLACHTKDGWENSAHAQQNVANESYTTAAANARGFPVGTQVWQSACLSCHDTHTVQGSRRLLRAGVDGSTTTLAGYTIKSGNGNEAIEETCYACHAAGGGGTLNNAGEVPDIQTDFQMARHMPISANDTGSNTEAHDIINADFIENPSTMGNGSRHAECTDCHNPHRVVKRRSFTQTNSGGGSDPEGTHSHTNNHTNIASGVLRGTWGVEPQYGSNSFHTNPSGYIVKSGEPTSTSTAVGNNWLTREYQVCLKCHSDYAFGNNPPNLGGTGLTPPGANQMQQYTNIAREFNSPDSHANEPLSVGSDGGAGGNWTNNNHRSWHPVIRSTGRTAGERNAATNNWLTPFQAIGTQTMYCTDCHGSNTAAGTVVPNGGTNGSPWGPHGSSNNFLLKGQWSGNVPGSQQNDNTGLAGTGEGGGQDHLCFKCHAYNEYAGTGTNASGFGGADGMCGGMCGGGMGGGMMGGGTMANLHTFHVGMVTNFRCNLCHVAVPHGWKNKNFLVNLNDVGAESTNGDSGQVRNQVTTGYNNGPYYNRAVLKVVNFATSGNWQPANCGSVGAPGNGLTGVNWMADGGGMDGGGGGGMDGGGGGMMGGGGGGGSEACDNVP